MARLSSLPSWTIGILISAQHWPTMTTWIRALVSHPLDVSSTAALKHPLTTLTWPIVTQIWKNHELRPYYITHTLDMMSSTKCCIYLCWNHLVILDHICHMKLDNCIARTCSCCSSRSYLLPTHHMMHAYLHNLINARECSKQVVEWADAKHWNQSASALHFTCGWRRWCFCSWCFSSWRSWCSAWHANDPYCLRVACTACFGTVFQHVTRIDFTMASVCPALAVSITVMNINASWWCDCCHFWLTWNRKNALR